MKMKLLYVPMVMTVMSALVITNSATTTRKTTTTPRTTTTPAWTTPGTSGINLNGKMFTLFPGRGGISFYAPYFYPTPTSWRYTSTYAPRRYTTRPYYTTTTPKTTTRPYRTTTTPKTTTRPYRTTTTPKTTTRPYRTTTTPKTTTRPYRTTTTPKTTTPITTRPWTTAPPTRGVSVCLRYLTDNTDSLFTLSPSRSPLQLRSINYGYQLIFNGYSSMYLRPNIRFWSNIQSEIWTSVCLTVDTTKNLAQMFSGSNMSIRKVLPTGYIWSGEPQIDFPGFDGQLTDVQMWHYPLRYKEVFNYMTAGVYAPYRGSVLTWSDISYAPRGYPILEDSYEQLAKQPVGRSWGRRGHRPKGKKKMFFKAENKRHQL